MDIGLPGMDGFEVARRLPLPGDIQGKVLVAVTGYGQEEILQMAKSAGFDHHLLKPLDLDALLNPPVPAAEADGSWGRGTTPSVLPPTID